MELIKSDYMSADFEKAIAMVNKVQVVVDF